MQKDPLATGELQNKKWMQYSGEKVGRKAILTAKTSF